jgi:hypothetical protein
VAAHILLVRKHGIVPPLRLSDVGSKPGAAAEPPSAPTAEPSR